MNHHESAHGTMARMVPYITGYTFSWFDDSPFSHVYSFELPTTEFDVFELQDVCKFMMAEQYCSTFNVEEDNREFVSVGLGTRYPNRFIPDSLPWRISIYCNDELHQFIMNVRLFDEL